MNQPIDPKQLAAQQALVRLLNTPPETILQMLDRLEIPWDKARLNDGDPDQYLLIKWSDLAAGEKRNQQEGPFMKKLVEEMRSEVAQINPLITGGN